MFDDEVREQIFAKSELQTSSNENITLTYTNENAKNYYQDGKITQISKQGKGRSSKRKGNRRCPFLFAHRRGYGVVPAAGRGTLPPQRQRISR